MTRILRIATYVIYPFLIFSMLLPLGLVFGVAFLARFSIDNRTDVPITVTPIGTVGPEGERRQLPVMLAPFLPLPALRSGGYRLMPGETVLLTYDMDDINFSEIVVESGGQMLQLVTDPTPTMNQYHGALQARYMIDDLTRLAKATPVVQAAAQQSNRQLVGACRLYGLLFGPWVVYGLLIWLASRQRRKST